MREWMDIIIFLRKKESEDCETRSCSAVGIDTFVKSLAYNRWIALHNHLLRRRLLSTLPAISLSVEVRQIFKTGESCNKWWKVKVKYFVFFLTHKAWCSQSHFPAKLTQIQLMCAKSQDNFFTFFHYHSIILNLITAKLRWVSYPEAISFITFIIPFFLQPKKTDWSFNTFFSLTTILLHSFQVTILTTSQNTRKGKKEISPRNNFIRLFKNFRPHIIISGKQSFIFQKLIKIISLSL